MPISIDITQDIRFQDGLRMGIRAASLAHEATYKSEIAKRLLVRGFDIPFVQEITGLSEATLEALARETEDR